MGAVCHKAKMMANAMDKEKLEMSVKANMLEIKDAATALAHAYTTQINAGQTVEVNAETVKPVTLEQIEKETIKLKLGADSKETERLHTAVYVAGNHAKREEIKREVMKDVLDELKVAKVPAGVIKKVEEKLPDMIIQAAEKQIKAMADKALKGEPLLSAEEEAKIKKFNEKKAAAEAAKHGHGHAHGHAHAPGQQQGVHVQVAEKK